METPILGGHRVNTFSAIDSPAFSYYLQPVLLGRGTRELVGAEDVWGGAPLEPSVGSAVSNAALAVSEDTVDDARVPSSRAIFGADAELLRARHLTPLDALRETRLQRCMRALAALCVIALCVLISWHIQHRFSRYGWGSIASIYTVVVTTYVLSRFILAAFYRAPKDAGITPSIAIVVPSFNEGEAVQPAPSTAAWRIDYPQDRIEVVVINDGSDRRHVGAHAAARGASTPRAQCSASTSGSNQGKRAAMAAGIRQTERRGARLRRLRLDARAAGHLPPRAAIRRGQRRCRQRAHVRAQRRTRTSLTRMQAARYYVSLPAPQDGRVDGRRRHVLLGLLRRLPARRGHAVLEQWEHQTFLGAPCTHGDDRSLTNMLLRARLQGALPGAGRGLDRRARPLRQVLPPAASLEEVVEPRGADPRDAHLALAAARVPGRRDPDVLRLLRADA